jgi:hypothetical protein
MIADRVFKTHRQLELAVIRWLAWYNPRAGLRTDRRHAAKPSTKQSTTLPAKSPPHEWREPAKAGPRGTQHGSVRPRGRMVDGQVTAGGVRVGQAREPRGGCRQRLCGSRRDRRVRHVVDRTHRAAAEVLKALSASEPLDDDRIPNEPPAIECEHAANLRAYPSSNGYQPGLCVSGAGGLRHFQID